MPARIARRNPTAAIVTVCVAFLAMSAGAPAQERIAERAQTRPAADEGAYRRLVWDRTKAAADLARQVAATEREVHVLVRQVETGEGRPAVPELKAAREKLKRLQEAAAEAQRALERELAGGAAATERAAYLGVTSSPADAVMRKQLRLPDGVGLVVDYVEPGSPAARAGLEAYDVALRLNEQILVNPPQLAVLVRTFDPGAEVTLTVLRGGKERPVAVRLVERDVKPLGDVVFGAAPDRRPAVARPSAATQPVATSGPADRLLEVGDELTVTVYDLEGPGLQTVVHTRVPPTGMLRIPYLRQRVVAFQRSEAGLQKAIADAYRSEHVTDHANVSVERVGTRSNKQD